METRNLAKASTPAASHLQLTQASVKLLLTVDEACEALGIKRTVFYSLLKGGKRTRRLTSVKVGSRRLIPVRSLEAFVASLCDEVD